MDKNDLILNQYRLSAVGLSAAGKFEDFNTLQSRYIRRNAWILFFEKIKVPYEDNRERCEIMPGFFFEPDFWLPDQDVFIIIGDGILDSKMGRSSALTFAKNSGKVLIRFWECKAGNGCPEKNDYSENWGNYITPEGEIGDSVEWGICNKCGSKHIGHFGCSSLLDRKYRNTSKYNCTCYDIKENKKLRRAYNNIRRLFYKASGPETKTGL